MFGCVVVVVVCVVCCVLCVVCCVVLCVGRGATSIVDADHRDAPSDDVGDQRTPVVVVLLYTDLHRATSEATANSFSL